MIKKYYKLNMTCKYYSENLMDCEKLYLNEVKVIFDIDIYKLKY
jgi:hypothetical protein